MRDLDCPSRRELLRVLGAAGVGVIGAGVLAACGADDGATATSGATSPTPTAGGGATSGGATGGDTTAAASPAPDPAPTAATTPATTAGPAGFEVALADVPVGEARVVDAGGRPVVVARLAEDEFVGWSAVCTHQNAVVQENGGLALRCPLHFSEFDATDGAATKGPATRPLAAVEVAVSGDRIVVS